MGYEHLFKPNLWLTELLSIIKIQDGSFVDIGANIGQTLIQVKSILKHTDYIAIEPNPACIYYLIQLVKKNKLENVQLFSGALSQEASFRNLFFFKDSITDTCATIIKNFRPQSDAIAPQIVPTIKWSTISNFLEIKDMAYVKIDVEGAELEVVRSLMGSIQRHKPIVFIEVLTSNSQTRTMRQKELSSLFTHLGYRILRIIKNQRGLERLVSCAGFQANKDPGNCDYLTYPISAETRMLELLSKHL